VVARFLVSALAGLSAVAAIFVAATLALDRTGQLEEDVVSSIPRQLTDRSEPVACLVNRYSSHLDRTGQPYEVTPSRTTASPLTALWSAGA
jgi:hypothetical protein